MKIVCTKCGKEIKNGEVCLSMADKRNLCSDCATVEALELDGDSTAKETLRDSKKA